MLKKLFPMAGAAMLLISGILAANNIGTRQSQAYAAPLATPTPTLTPPPSPTPKEDPEKPAPSPTMQP